jgi:hypothetical protein
MRYRVEIYDEYKGNDLTFYSENNYDRDRLVRLVKDNVYKFDGDIRAYVYDNIKNKKIIAMFLPTWAR